jgi:hypothetical protein
MRTLRLAQSAFSAEGLRLRMMLRRLAIHAALATIGLVFLTGALAIGHAAVFLLLRPKFGSLNGLLILLAADLVIGIGLLLIAANGGPGRVEREALELRERARLQAIETLARATVILPLLRTAMRLLTDFMSSRRR